MADFGKAHEFTAKWEGGISDHPADRGGYTAYGVSQEFLRDWHGTKEGKEFLARYGFGEKFSVAQMKKLLTRGVAMDIFKRYFWMNQELSSWPSQALATVYYDMSVNHGKGGACRMLQKALNLVNNAKLVVDGKLGPLSKAAAQKGGIGAAFYLLFEREAYFRAIVERNQSQGVFLKGWLNRLEDLKRYIRDMN